MTPTFQGEVQLAGWSESHSGGCKVTFWLSTPSDLDAFRAMTVRKGNTAGQRLACVLVEIGDDEQPVEPKAAERPKGGPLAKLAGIWCNDPDFRAWLNGTFESADLVHNAEEAAELVRFVCGCESRAELDNNPAAKARFDKFIRGPYSKYLTALGVPA